RSFEQLTDLRVVRSPAQRLFQNGQSRHGDAALDGALGGGDLLVDKAPQIRLLLLLFDLCQQLAQRALVGILAERFIELRSRPGKVVTRSRFLRTAQRRRHFSATNVLRVQIDG